MLTEASELIAENPPSPRSEFETFQFTLPAVVPSARTKSVSCTHDTNCLPEPAAPPSPSRTRRDRAGNAPPSVLITIALRSATFRVPGVFA